MKPGIEPMTGIRKKLRKDPAPAYTVIRRPAQLGRDRRGGSAQRTTWDRNSATVAPTSTHHSTGSGSFTVHHITPAHTSHDPGTPGTSTPHRPSRRTRPTSSRSQ